MELAIGIIGILLTLWGIKLQFFSKPKEELKHFIIQFKSTQRLSLQVQEDFEKLIVEHNGWECEMFPNFTYKTCLEEMKSAFKKNLTDKVLNDFISQKPSKTTILSATQSLEKQFENLMKLNANINLVSRQIANDECII